MCSNSHMNLHSKKCYCPSSKILLSTIFSTTVRCENIALVYRNGLYSHLRGDYIIEESINIRTVSMFGHFITENKGHIGHIGYNLRR